MPDSVSAAEQPIMRDDVGIVLQVVAQHGGDDLHLVAEAVGEQRADRPVDQAGDQHLGFSLGRPSRLKKPPGILPAANAFSW